MSQFCPVYFNEKYDLVMNKYFFLMNSIFKVSSSQTLTKSIKTDKTNACCCFYLFVYISKSNALHSNNKFKSYWVLAMLIALYLPHFQPSVCVNKNVNPLSKNFTEWSNILKPFVIKSRWFVSLRLTVLLGSHLKAFKILSAPNLTVPEQDYESIQRKHLEKHPEQDYERLR